jgi:uncharacterized protein YbjT (DUF2867 family)
MTTKLTVLVSGATGKQGGAVARRLLQRGHAVRALTRKADSPAAQALASAGATLVTGSLDDEAGLRRALDGASAMFAMSTPFEAGTDAETRQGVTAANAAKAAGTYLVYTSVGGADRATGIPHFDSKYVVERHIREIGVPAAIVAPTYFMENLYFSRAQLAQGVYASALAPDRALAQVAVADIAAFAVLALEDAARFAGTRHDIAGDELSGTKTMEILGRVTGKPLSHFQVPMEMIRQMMGEDGVKMYEWFERVGYTVDLPKLKLEFPDVGWHDYEAWARTQDFRGILG